MTSILTKIKYKGILFEYIQGFVSTRLYILPYLIHNDKILQEQLKIFNGILEDNKLSLNFINNFFSFISGRILFRNINEEKNIMNDNLYAQEEVNNKFKNLKKRIINIYKHKKINKETKISINDLKKYIPNEKEFALFIYDFLGSKSNFITIP